MNEFEVVAKMRKAVDDCVLKIAVIKAKVLGLSADELKVMRSYIDLCTLAHTARALGCTTKHVRDVVRREHCAAWLLEYQITADCLYCVLPQITATRRLA